MKSWSNAGSVNFLDLNSLTLFKDESRKAVTVKHLLIFFFYRLLLGENPPSNWEKWKVVAHSPKLYPGEERLTGRLIRLG